MAISCADATSIDDGILEDEETENKVVLETNFSNYHLSDNEDEEERVDS